MKPSPLNLHYYYVTDLTFSVNKTFKPNSSNILEDANLRIVPGVERSEDPDSEPEWIVSLKVQQLAADDVPYSFSVEVLGHFSVSPLVPEDQREKLLHLNGVSILYGSVREIVRSLSATGPYMPIILPSVSFMPEKAERSIETNLPSSSVGTGSGE